MNSFNVQDIPIFEKNNLTPIGKYPDRYIIEFHDILTDYFGYIFQKPIVKRDGENISEVEFNIIDRQGNINKEELVKLQVLIANNCKFEKSLRIKEYSIKLKELLEDIKDLSNCIKTVDLLINNAGIHLKGSVNMTSIDYFHKIFKTNFIGADIVEVSPPFDVNNMTSLVGATIAFEILCTMTRTN